MDEQLQAEEPLAYVDECADCGIAWPSRPEKAVMGNLHHTTVWRGGVIGIFLSLCSDCVFRRRDPEGAAFNDRIRAYEARHHARLFPQDAP